ncbi:MAG: hypothetical protein R3E66_17560 [bacterium]
MRAPYAFIHLQTYEEERAVAVLREIAEADNRSLREWSALTSFDGQPSNGDFAKALAIIESSPLPGVFVCKDVAPFLDSPLVRRRLREMEAQAAAFHKTIVFVGPQPIITTELQRTSPSFAYRCPTGSRWPKSATRCFPNTSFPNVDRAALVTGAMGLTAREAHRAYHRVRLQYVEASQRNRPFDLEKSIIAEKQQLVATNDALEFFPIDAGMGDVGGLERAQRVAQRAPESVQPRSTCLWPAASPWRAADRCSGVRQEPHRQGHRPPLGTAVVAARSGRGLRRIRAKNHCVWRSPPPTRSRLASYGWTRLKKAFATPAKAAHHACWARC